MSFFMADQKIIKSLNYPQGYRFGLDPNVQGMYDMPVDGIIAFWNMSKTIDNKILESINGYDAVVRNGIDIVDGIIGNALSFDGTTEVDLGAVPHVCGIYTISMWLKVFNMTSPGTLYYAERNVDDNLLISIDGGYLKCINYLGVDEYVLSTEDTIPQNEWLHFLYTYSGELKRIYLNNILKCEHAVVGHYLGSIVHHNLGYNGVASNNHCNLIVDQLRLYNRVLNSEERSKLTSERIV